MNTLKGGQDERSGWRDQWISGWIRTLKDCPFVDLDFIGVTYDQKEPVAIIDWKQARAEGHVHATSEANIECQRRLADRAKLPFFVVYYSADPIWFAVTPVNGIACQIVSEHQRMSELDFTKFMFQLSGRSAPAEALQGRSSTAAPAKAKVTEGIHDEFELMMKKLNGG
jgi:hypothetical protein